MTVMTNFSAGCDRERHRHQHIAGRALLPPAVILVGVVLALVFSFFFPGVAADAVATTARNPVSGMTMLTIIISSELCCCALASPAPAACFCVMALAGIVYTALSDYTDGNSGFQSGLLDRLKHQQRRRR